MASSNFIFIFLGELEGPRPLQDKFFIFILLGEREN